MTVTTTDATTSKKVTGAHPAPIPTAGSAPAGSDETTSTRSSSDTSFDRTPTTHVAPAAHVAPPATVSTVAKGGHGANDPTPDHPGTPGATDGTAAGTAGGGSSSTGNAAWQQGGWNQKFSQLLQNDDAVSTLRDADLDDATYQKYYDELSTELQTGQVGDSSLSADNAVGTTDASGGDVTGGPTTTSTAAAEPSQPLDATEEKKFRDLFSLMGTPQDQSDAAITQLQGAGSDQRAQVYQQLQGALGSWNDDWKKKFQDAFDAAKTPPDQQAQYFASLSGNNNDDTKLQAALDAVQPGWNLKTRQMFSDMNLPDEMIKQLEDQHLSVAQYKAAASAFTDARQKYITDGRMKKLDDASATEQEKWQAVLNDVSGVKLDEYAASVKKEHNQPSIWQRIGSFALNLIPGVGLAEYITGQDWVTGEKIDRTNPFSIGMAVLSAVPVAGLARGGIAAVKTGATIAADVAAESAATAAASEGAEALSGGGKILEGAVDTSKAIDAASEGGKVLDLGENVLKEGSTIAVDSKGVATVVDGTAGVADATKGTSLLGRISSMTDASGAKVDSQVASDIATGGKEAGQVSDRVLDTAKYYDSGNKGLDALRKVRAFVPGLRGIGKGGEAFRTASGLAAADSFNGQLAERLGKLSADELSGLSKVSANGGALVDESGARVISEADANAIQKITGMDVQTLSRVSQQAQQLGRGEGVVAQGSAKVWNFNPVKNNATVDLQDAAKTPWYKVPQSYVLNSGADADSDLLRLGSKVKPGTTAGFAQTAGALDARALSGMSADELAAAGVTDASQLGRTAAIGQDLDAGLSGTGRIRQAILPNSEASVQHAIDLQNHTSTAWNAARAVARPAVGVATGLAGLAGGTIGTMTLTGQSGQMYGDYQQAQGFADREQAEYEQQQAVLNGQAPDPVTGFYMDPKTGLEIDQQDNVEIDPKTGDRYDLTTGEIVNSGQAAGSGDGDTQAAGAVSGDGTDTTGDGTQDTDGLGTDGSGTDGTDPTDTTDDGTGDGTTEDGVGGAGDGTVYPEVDASTTTGDQDSQLVGAGAASGEYE